MDKKELVRNGYNSIARAYLEMRLQKSPNVSLLDALIARLPERARVLDAGCGAGIPVTEILAGRFRVIGMDFSEVQLNLAKMNVPKADYICGDMTIPTFAESTFDGICSYYSIIHIPRELHGDLFREFHRILKPGGLALLCLGANDLENDLVDDYNGAPMYWSHFDAETNLNLLSTCGFDIICSELINDATSPVAHHLFVLAGKRQK